jgi:hypothetical protein
MMYRMSRGAALVETALTIGVSLLIVLGAAQMALIGYTQISADGAAFIAAHTAASNPSANSVTTATGVFSQFNSGNFSAPSPAPQLDPSVVSKVVSGFSLVPGLASTYTVTGKDVEYQAAGANTNPSTYAFDTNNTVLLNFCAPPGTSCSFPSNHCIYLANSIGTGNGNGANGQFAEWRAHQRVFARLAQSFHQVTPTTGSGALYHTNLDVGWNSSDESTVYGWDGASVCS